MKLLTTTAVLLALSTPTQAEIWDYKFSMWSIDYFLEGEGRIESAARAVGVPVFLLSGGVRNSHYLLGGPNCLHHVETCTPDPTVTLTVTQVSWWESNGGLYLGFSSLEQPSFFTTRPGTFGDMSTEFTLTPVAVPGPITGASLPALALGWLGLWGYRRRRA